MYQGSKVPIQHQLVYTNPHNIPTNHSPSHSSMSPLTHPPSPHAPALLILLTTIPPHHRSISLILLVPWPLRILNHGTELCAPALSSRPVCFFTLTHFGNGFSTLRHSLLLFPRHRHRPSRRYRPQALQSIYNRSRSPSEAYSSPLTTSTARKPCSVSIAVP